MKKNVSIKLFIFMTLILIKASNEKFLRLDTKKQCPKMSLSRFGVFISLADSGGDEKCCQSDLKEEGRKEVEEYVNLKRSFASTMSYIPSSFSPERNEYWRGLNTLMIIFIVLSFFPGLFIIFYLVMRFVLKKCTGPKKISQVNKLYRNFTWVLMIFSTLLSVILIGISLIYSETVGVPIIHKEDDNPDNPYGVKVFKNATKIMEEQERIVENIANKTVEEINNITNEYGGSSFFNDLHLPSVKYMVDFNTSIKEYFTNSTQRTEKIINDENMRKQITRWAFLGYYIFVILAFICFFYRLEKLECFISIILLFAIPGIIVLEGYNATFFFYYGDLCDSVNAAIYENKRPVADQSLGYYYNCFPRDIKASIYNIRSRLYEASKNLTNNDTLYEKYEEFKSFVDKSVVKCDIVCNFIPKIESHFCKTSLSDMYFLIKMMTWIILTTLGVAIGSRRLQVLIWKKRIEIESMIQNQEIVY